MAAVRSSRDIIIQTPNLEAARAFYEGVLGFAVVMDEPNMIGLDTGSIRLFVERRKAHPATLDFLTDDFEGLKSRLLAAGCRIEEDDPSLPRCYCVDPFGLHFNVCRA
jgi:catechol 2,3-dioxygenase-like lactoylglutathione lyase family enzyme